jgi:N-acetyl-gamma-glutamyl-phosphate reductase
MTVRVGVAGASGYAGAELLRLCAGHPRFDVVVAGADSQADQAVGSLYPSLAAAYPRLHFTKAGPEDFDGLDVVFLALPHGESAVIAPELVDRVGVLVDLSADFRLRDVAAYTQWYDIDHPAPELLGRFAYGLPELFRSDLEGARLVAAPGCYPTAAALALAPLVRAEMVEPLGVIVDAASGVSGAGRKLAASTQFATVDEDFVAYGLLTHRHTPEIEQATGAQVLFTPHLAPMNRGILATCYARPVAGSTLVTDDVLGVLRETYLPEPFVVVGEGSPSTKATYGSNAAHVTGRFDERTGWVLAICAIDNLGKGASGQAVQCANLALGRPEAEGLTVSGLYP